jgi:hypothetical protein
MAASLASLLVSAQQLLLAERFILRPMDIDSNTIPSTVTATH